MASTQPLMRGYTPTPVPSRRLVYVQLDATQGFQTLALTDGMSRDDVAACLRNAAGLGKDEEFMLADASDGALTPVSAALPAGARLVLRRTGRSTPAKQAETESNKDSKEMVKHTEAMKHFGKISNYLANDRTMLAWTRTSLALGRTLFTIAALTAATEGWYATLNTCTIMLAFLTVAFFVVGFLRFRDVRSSLDENHAPAYMLERLAERDDGIARGISRNAVYRVYPTGALLGVTVLVIVLGAAIREFHK